MTGEIADIAAFSTIRDDAGARYLMADIEDYFCRL